MAILWREGFIPSGLRRLVWELESLNLWAKPEIWNDRPSFLTAHKSQSLSSIQKSFERRPRDRNGLGQLPFLASWGSGRKLSKSSQTALGKPSIHKTTRQGMKWWGWGWFDAFSTVLSLFVHSPAAPKSPWSLAGDAVGVKERDTGLLVLAQICFLLRAARRHDTGWSQRTLEYPCRVLPHDD